MRMLSPPGHRLEYLKGVVMPYDEKEAHALAESMGTTVYHVFLLEMGPICRLAPRRRSTPRRKLIFQPAPPGEDGVLVLNGLLLEWDEALSKSKSVPPRKDFLGN
jgi:hypothetical protein